MLILCTTSHNARMRSTTKVSSQCTDQSFSVLDACEGLKRDDGKHGLCDMNMT